MPQRDNRTADSPLSNWIESGAAAGDKAETARISALQACAAEQAGAAIARELNGPLTALLLYMGEIKQHSHRLSLAAGNQDYLQMIVDNALQQTERVCALVKQLGGGDAGPAASVPHAAGEVRIGRSGEGLRRPDAGMAPVAGRKPLTRREREVLNLISQGYSNKEGAARMRISPRTFESHRAEAMRKLGARNTADLVRAALLHPLD